MNRTRTPINRKQLSLLSLFAALAVAGTASAADSAGFPPQLGKLCGSVNGATWRFNGQTGTHYNVIAKTSAMCAAGMKSVSGLTKQTPHAGALGPHTLTGPRGFRCLLTLAPAHSGYCGSTGPNSLFYWAPRLNK
ncbi:MAG TPA: hypothetical protein VFA66_07300 [Gaiellaceae bacterium]|nr:hypothetical protein [Gaiellaceae bacterium]